MPRDVDPDDAVIAFARRFWRSARSVPALGRLLGLLDLLWWFRKVHGSGLVDAGFYAAQRGWRRVSSTRASLDYIARGFRSGLSPNPLFDEAIAGRSLPDRDRVPALYAYLVSDRKTVQVHPWWASSEYRSTHQVAGGALEHAWAHRDSTLVVAVGGKRAEMSVAQWRDIALDAVRERTIGDVAPAQSHVVRLLQGGDRDLDAKIRPVLDIAGSETRAAIVCVGLSPSSWAAVAIALAADPTAVAVRLPAETSFARVLDWTRRHVRTGVVAVLDPRAVVAAPDLRHLLSQGAHAVVIPAVLAQDGTIAAVGAGVIDTAQGARRVRILADHPAEDLRGLGSAVLEVPLPTGRTFVAPASLLERANEGLPEGFELEAMVVRHRADAGSLPSRVDMGVMIGCFGEETAFAGVSTELPLIESTTVDATAIDRIYRSASFVIDGWDAADRRDAHARVRRLSSAQRWAIKTCAPAGPAGESWGETHFARGLASALRRLGHEVVIDSFTAANRSTTFLDDVCVVVRGPFAIVPPVTGIRIEWIISHPDQITRDEVRRFDLVYAASDGWAARVQAAWGLKVEPLLECTDADQFFPRGTPRTTDVVFVGTARGIARPSVVVPLAAGIDVKVYGPDWRGFIPAAAIVADSIPNSQLSERYESAAVVLNDHWPAMRREGFMAMRPFDVVAAGGRVISESVPGLREIFGEALREYDTEEELVDLLREDFDDAFPSPQRMAELSARVRREHSFDARAHVLDDAVRKFAGSRSVD